MKNLLLGMVAIMLLFHSCKKEDAVAPKEMANSKKFAVNFRVSGFKLSVEGISKLSAAPTIAATPADSSSIGEIYYLVYNSEGEELYRKLQASDGYTSKYAPDSDPEFQEGEFGNIQDSLSAGTYTIVFLAGPINTFGINYYQPYEQSVFRPLSEASFEYGGGLDNWSRATETFYKKLTVTVGSEPLEQNVTLDRIVGKIIVHLEDVIPANAAYFRFFYNGETIGIMLNDLSNFNPADDEEYAPKIPITEEDKEEAGYEHRQYISNTNTPIEVVINCYDADDNIIASKTVSNVPVDKNKKTILTGRLFSTGTTTPASFSISLNDEWDEETENIPF